MVYLRSLDLVPGRCLYRFKRIPFGLANAPAIWSTSKQLDDVTVVLNSFGRHLEILDIIFNKYLKAGLRKNITNITLQFVLQKKYYVVAL